MLIGSILLAGLACAQDQPEAAPASATPAATATQDSKEAQGAKSDEKKKPQFKPPPGYRVKILGWDIVYCRKTAVLGSRFPKEVCMTEAQLKEHLAANEEMRRNKDQASRVCTGSACN
jgi:hypothetical protein